MRKVLANFTSEADGPPQTLSIEQGTVTWRGPATEFVTVDGDEVHDLSGKMLAPGFVDSHCHILPAGLDLQKLHLGACATHDEVLDALRMRILETSEGEWLHAVHYDQTKFPEGRHMSRPQLDAIGGSCPVLLRHSNGHASVANSAALAAAGIAEDVQDPQGGTYVRDDSGRLTGVLLERAHEFVTNAAPEPSLDAMVQAIQAAAAAMRAVGVTCASDMMTGRWNLLKELEAYRIASSEDCPVRMRLYVQWSTVFGPRGIGADGLRIASAEMAPDRCRVAGIKIFADGAISSATAAIYGTYPDGSNGATIYEASRLNDMVRTADAAGFQLAIHSIGDRSTDMVFDAFALLPNARRHRIEHAMLLSDAQIDRMAEVGCRCTMQPEFLVRFGHAYPRQLGAVRASLIKRARSVMEAGIRLSFSSDRPIVSGDPLVGIAAATMRPEGFDPAENVDRQAAIANYTEMGLDANEDPPELGGLQVGGWGDYRVIETPRPSN